MRFKLILIGQSIPPCYPERATASRRIRICLSPYRGDKSGLWPQKERILRFRASRSTQNDTFGGAVQQSAKLKFELQFGVERVWAVICQMQCVTNCSWGHPHKPKFEAGTANISYKYIDKYLTNMPRVFIMKLMGIFA